MTIANVQAVVIAKENAIATKSINAMKIVLVVMNAKRVVHAENVMKIAHAMKKIPAMTNVIVKKKRKMTKQLSI